VTLPRTNLKALDRAALAAWIAGRGEKPFRARQIWAWMHRRAARSFADMTDLSRGFRESLERDAELGALRPAAVTASPESGTRKFLWESPAGGRFESVFIPEAGRNTVCVSSQVGCALACAFCATGRLGAVRDLEAWEIVDQVLGVVRETGSRVTNVVVMGMGEPFLNYDAVLAALDVLNDPEGLAIGHRRITVSTAGVIPGIARWASEGRPYKLAVSLNAPEDAVRSAIMPVNRRWPIAGLLDAVRGFTRRTGHRVTFEYVLMRGVNDSLDHARRLLDLLSGLPCKVNVIPYNAASGGFERPDPDRIEAFLEAIKPLASPVMVRWSRGTDIAAACGQLAASGGAEGASPADSGPDG
jgi:23S rRNA (adenine2503-C2)-methyltransferase